MHANPPCEKFVNGSVEAASFGNVTVIATFVALEFCGSEEGEKLAVAPGGSPVTEKVTGAGKVERLGWPTAST